MSIQQKCFKYKLRPTRQQEQQFLVFADSRRCAYNWALRTQQEHYKKTKGTDQKKHLTPVDLNKLWTPFKNEPGNEWLCEQSAVAIQQMAFRDLDKAFKAFFKKTAKYPKFRSRENCPNSFCFPLYVKIVEGGISIPKIGIVKAKIDRIPPTETKSATIRQDVDGKWFVTFTTHFELPDVAPTCDRPVGIDMGLINFVTLSTGETIDHDKFYRKAERKIARFKRRLQRRTKGSNGYKQAKLSLAKLNKKIRNKRESYQHDVSARITRDHDVICVESLNVNGMARTRLAKSIHDAAISAFLFKLDYKSRWKMGRMVKVDRWFASTKICSECGEKTKLALSERIWTCPHCGTKHRRDENAAKNILVEGLKSLS